MAVNDHPAREQPRTDECDEQRKGDSPSYPERVPFAQPGGEERIHEMEEVEVHEGDDEKPGKRPPMPRYEAEVVAQSAAERFAVKDQRHLHRGEQEQDPGKYAARSRNPETDNPCIESPCVF